MAANSAGVLSFDLAGAVGHEHRGRHGAERAVAEPDDIGDALQRSGDRLEDEAIDLVGCSGIERRQLGGSAAATRHESGPQSLHLVADLGFADALASHSDATLRDGPDVQIARCDQRCHDRLARAQATLELADGQRSRRGQLRHRRRLLSHKRCVSLELLRGLVLEDVEREEDFPQRLAVRRRGIGRRAQEIQHSAQPDGRLRGQREEALHAESRLWVDA